MKWNIITGLYSFTSLYMITACTYIRTFHFIPYTLPDYKFFPDSSAYFYKIRSLVTSANFWIPKNTFQQFYTPAFIQIHITPNITPPPIFHDEYKCIHSPNHYFFPSTATAASISSSLSFLALTFTFWILLLLLLSLSICIAACFSSSVIVSNT